jgi:predicted transcriptional regulator
LISIRLNDLKKQGIIKYEQNYYQLTTLGIKFIKFFNFFKRFFFLRNKG